MKPFKTTLLISTYNWPEALDLVLMSVKKQTVLPDEVIIADDGSKEETRKLIQKYQENFPVPLIHQWHEDNGFRKTIILNKSIKEAKGDYIIQVDGDIILHRRFVEDHIKYAEKGFFVKGSRGRLTEEKSQKVLSAKNITFSSLEPGIKSTINATRFPLFAPLFFGNANSSRNIKGCNFAFWRTDAVAVNGYNNDISGWGHEDIEFPARMINLGIKKKQLKMVAVCFHIYHKIVSRKSEADNLSVYYNVVENKIVRCKNGIDQV